MHFSNQNFISTYLEENLDPIKLFFLTIVLEKFNFSAEDHLKS